MGSAVKMRTDFSAAELRRLAKISKDANQSRRLAKISKDANQSRRLLSLAAVLDGMSREDAARVGGMDRQTLRDWVHRFNAAGPGGLKDAWWTGPEPRLSCEQKAELAQIVETGPDPAIDGVVRWRRVDLQKLIRERFGVAYHERYVSTLLKELGVAYHERYVSTLLKELGVAYHERYVSTLLKELGVAYHERYVSTLLKELGVAHMSARPRHPAQDGRILEAFKKTSRAR
jgi:transposase